MNKRQRLLPGRMGAEQTLNEMRRLTIEAIQSQVPRDYVILILRGCYAQNPESLAIGLFHFLMQRIIIIDEFEEVLRSPLILLSEIEANGKTSGDCDDCAMLSASLLASAGAMVRFRAIERQLDGSYAHVFTEYKFPRRGEWLQFDITVSGRLLPVSDSDLFCNIIS